MEKFLDTYPPHEKIEDGIAIHGFFRLQINDPEKGVIGDSGWCKNTVPNEGKRHYLAQLLADLAGSSQVGYAALGTGGTVATDGTSLPGELAEGVRDAVSAQTNGSSAIRFTGTFASADSFVTATRDISNIGLFATDSGGSIFAGNTYASSSCATNQAVNYTYDITFT
jgi:hypothetical protein